MARSEQVDRRRPVGGGGPCEAELGTSITKFVGGLRKMRGVDPEQRIERFDFDVETLRHERGRAPQLGQTAHDAHLADLVRFASDRGDKR